MQRDAGEWEYGGSMLPLPFQKECNEGGGAFS